MSNLKKRFNLIIEELEQNIKNKEDLEYIKSQIYNIAIIFLDELDKLVELNFNRLNVMIDREKELAGKISKMEKILSEIEKEVYAPEDNDCDFEIICPYCNTEFIVDLESGMENEVKCPDCGNSIELDWHDDECCGHSHCGECDDCMEDEDREEDFESEDEYENEEENEGEDDM